MTYISIVVGFLVYAHIFTLEEEGRAPRDKYSVCKDNNNYKNEAVKRFLLPMMAKMKATIWPRQRMRLSILLDKKIGSKISKNSKQGGRSRCKDRCILGGK